MAAYMPSYPLYKQAEEKFLSRGYTREEARGSYYLWHLSPTFPFYAKGNTSVYIDAIYADLAKLLARIEGIEPSKKGARPNDRFEAFKFKSVQQKTGRVVYESWKFDFSSEQGCNAFMDICEAYDKGGVEYASVALAAVVAKADPKTQRTQVTKARVGQFDFRKNLVQLWKTCAVTGCAVQKMLKASHMKPWADSNPVEKLDPFNGLLLTPNLDALFDAGLISFDEDGRIIFSSKLSAADFLSLGVMPDMKLRKMNAAHTPYLEYHRTNVFHP